jgi:hypothetical protein
MKSTTWFVISVCAAALTVAGGCAAPSKPAEPPLRVVPVAEWGGSAMSPESVAMAKKHKPQWITLHHGGVAFLRDKDPKQYLRNLQSWSRGTRKWADIPYHYLIDLDGNVYEGRDVNYAGDTNTEYDPTGHALIVVLGNFEEVDPNPAQLSAVTSTMVMLAKRFNINPDKIAGHKDYSGQTACPGKSLYPYLQNGYFKQQVSAALKQSP